MGSDIWRVGGHERMTRENWEGEIIKENSSCIKQRSKDFLLVSFLLLICFFIERAYHIKSPAKWMKNNLHQDIFLITLKFFTERGKNIQPGHIQRIRNQNGALLKCISKREETLEQNPEAWHIIMVCYRSHTWRGKAESWQVRSLAMPKAVHFPT